MDKATRVIERLHTQFPELDQIEEAGAVGTFMKGAAQNLGQQIKTAAVNTAKKVVPQGIQQAYKAGQQAVQQKAAPQQQPQGQNLEQQFQKAGQSADLESQFAQVGQANSAGTADLINDLTDPTEVFTSALQALQTFANQPEPTQPTQQAAPKAEEQQPEVNTQQRTAESLFKHPEYRKLQSLYEADAPDQAAEFKQAVTKFLGKYSDPAVLAKDQKGQQILQKLVQVAGNLGINIPDMPSADQIKNAASAGAAQQGGAQQAAGAPTAVNSPDDLKKALDANPQAAQAFVQALTRAPKNGPIGQAFNNLLQKPAQ